MGSTCLHLHQNEACISNYYNISSRSSSKSINRWRYYMNALAQSRGDSVDGQNHWCVTINRSNTTYRIMQFAIPFQLDLILRTVLCVYSITPVIISLGRGQTCTEFINPLEISPLMTKTENFENIQSLKSMSFPCCFRSNRRRLQSIGTPVAMGRPLSAGAISGCFNLILSYFLHL